MQEVITDLKIEDQSEKAVWLKEASLWRLPYWDWATRDNTMPHLFTTMEISVRAPKGAKQPYEKIGQNPLFRYQLQDETGKPVLMGSLKDPYTIPDHVDEDSGVTYPVWFLVSSSRFHC